MQHKQVNSRVSVEAWMVGEEVPSVRQGRGETMASSFKFHLTIQQNILFWRDIYFKVVFETCIYLCALTSENR